MDKHKVILLVEDNKQDELLTIRALQKHGIRNEIVVCRDGAEALDWLFARGSYSYRDVAVTPTLVLLDLKLPKLSGHEVLAAIRGNKNTKGLPVVILTPSIEI
jgi:two-component system response regulator